MRTVITLALTVFVAWTVACEDGDSPAPTALDGILDPAGQPKVDVCHWDAEAEAWEKISIAQPAVEAHLRNHDDAEAGGTTAETGTTLDESCVPVPPADCPCFELADVEVPDNPFLTEIGCADLPASEFRGRLTTILVKEFTAEGESRGWTVARAGEGTGGLANSCFTPRPSWSSPQSVITNISTAEFESCRAILLDKAVELSTRPIFVDPPTNSCLE